MTLSDKLPGPQAWLFSVRTFAAALLALYICFAFDLDRPYWAMASVYIASQPLSGATRSKAAYRFLGTVLGAAAAIALVPNLVDAPPLLALAMSLWTGACLYFALLDRTPRSYVFMLAGYTAAIIGFPSVDSPATIFTTAVARVQEIGIGIACASIMASVVFPRRVQPVLADRLDQWLASASDWSLAILRGDDTGIARAKRQALAGDLAEIDLLTSYLAWDPTAQSDALRTLRALRRRLLMLLPELSALHDRTAALRDTDGLAPLQSHLAAAAAWIADTGADRAPASLRQPPPENPPTASWNDLLRLGLLDRLDATVDLLEDCRRLHRHLRNAGPFPSPLAYDRTQGAALVRHVDHARALWSAGAAAIAILIICTFWIATAWTSGANAAVLAAVVCSFFAVQDDPVPAILNFLWWSLAAIVVDAIYLFVLLPPLSDFPMLALALAPIFLTYGALCGNPKTASIGLPLAANGSTLLSLQATYDAQFAPFVDSAVALVVGIGMAAVITAVIRSVGAEWSATRLIRQSWADLADAAEQQGAGNRARFAGLMLDRIGLLAPRIAAAGPDSAVNAVDMLAELRAGLNIVMLRKVRRALPDDIRAAVEHVLATLARHFRARAAGQPGLPDDTLLAALDAALAKTAAAGRTRAMLALIGLRRALLPGAAAYQADAA